MGARWASDDDTDTLLEEILTETEEDAAREEADMEAAITARERAGEADAARQRARRADAIAQRLAAEQARQNRLHQRRTQRMQALRAPEEEPDVAAKEAQAPPASTPAHKHKEAADHDAMRRQMEHMRVQMVAIERARTLTPSTNAPGATSKGSWRLPVAVAALVLLLSGMGALGVGLSRAGYTTDPMSYPKLSMQPVTTSAAVVAVPVEWLTPAAQPVAAPSDEDDIKARPKVRPARPAAPAAPDEKPSGLDLDIELEGEGGIWGSSDL